jgi:hypothetical protein
LPYSVTVPDKGKAERQLAPATWYLGVKASSTRNASYRLRASSGNAATMDPAGGSVSSLSLAGGDWRYFHFTAPADAPATWRLTFNRTQGNANLYIRDTVPPGNYDSPTALRNDSTDAKNSGSYQSAGYSSGLITYGSPILRAGHHYWVGVQAVSDTEFSLSSSIEGSLSSIPVLPFTNGVFTGPLNPGESRLFRVSAPLRASQFIAGITGSIAAGSVSGRIEQSSLPTLTGSAHGIFSSSITKTMGTDALATWPWVNGYDFYIRLTNTSAAIQTPTLTLGGVLTANPDTRGRMGAGAVQQQPDLQ